jgi:hypothetical protein
MHRSIADQTIEELGGPRSVLARQRRDHAELDRLLERCRSTTGPEQQQALRATWQLVFPHAFAEESVLWPALRRAASDGEVLTLRVEEEHQEINQLVTEIERMQPGDPGWDELLERTFALLDRDVRDEEDLLLPALQRSLDGPALQRLGRSWELVRRTAPTRPHPVVSRRPPGNVAAALPLTLVDRSRDALDRAALGGQGAVATGSRLASRGLAALAGAIERLPPVRRGEDPRTSVGTGAHGASS